MKLRPSADRWLALICLAAALLLIFVWVPLDTETGLAEKVRRRFVIGDALGPTIAGAVIALGAALVWLRPLPGPRMELRNLIWLLRLLMLFALALLVMRFAGPIALSWMEGGYRPFRATAPYSYTGFLLGGTLLVGGLTALATKRIRLTDFAIAFATALAIALLYDLPFDDLLLPPNGDV